MRIPKKKSKAASAAVDIASMCASFGDGCSEAIYENKDTVFRQGDASDAVFYIKEGRVQLSVVSEQGKEGVIAMLALGEFFGEGCLAGELLHMTSAVIMDRSIVVKISKNTMVRALHEDSDFAHTFTAFLLTRNIQIQADLVDQLFNSSEKRLARLLLLLANFGKEGKMEMRIPKVNQDVLAARVGTTRSRINFFMNKFRRLGFIEYNGYLKVHASLMNVIILDPVDAPTSRRDLGRKHEKR
jgi:CRP-like cAMP-binding protein